MSARAEAPAFRAQGSLTKRVGLGAAGLVAASLATPAAAEIGATVSAFSDDRFRGYSLSEARPVAILDLAYDASSGFYADASATGVLRSGGDPSLLGYQLTAGYAKQLPSGTTLDAGATASGYSHYSTTEGSRSYAQVYAGISRGAISSRLFLSPHYSEAGLWTAYGELNGNFSPARNWGLEAHAGILLPLRTPDENVHYRTALDWRLGVTRQLGRVSLHAAWVEGAHGREYYGDRVHSRGAIVLGASLPL